MTCPSVAAWAAECLRLHLHRLGKELRGVTGKESAACIHQARVAARRLRVTLWFFRDVFPRPQRTRGEKHLRRLIRKLGRIRDLDVQRHILESWAATAAGGQYFEIHAAAARWASARRKSISRLRRLKKAWKRAHFSAGMERMRNDINAAADGKKHMHRRAAKKFSRGVSRVEAGPGGHDRQERLHQRRADFRTLRYTLEICQAMPCGRGRKQLAVGVAKARQFQDVLGRVHDMDRLREELCESKKARVVSPAARQFLAARCVQEHRNGMQKFRRLWRQCVREQVWEKCRRALET